MSPNLGSCWGSFGTQSVSEGLLHCPNVPALAPARYASASCRVLFCRLALPNVYRRPQGPPKAPEDRRQPQIYPNSSPDHRVCNFFTPLRYPHAVHRWIRGKGHGKGRRLGDGSSGHAGRVGMAQDLLKKGVKLPALMTAGRLRKLWRAWVVPTLSSDPHSCLAKATCC